MRIEEIVAAIRKRQSEMQENVFRMPPQKLEDFAKQMGVWVGLGEALSIIEDAKRKELQNEQGSD